MEINSPFTCNNFIDSNQSKDFKLRLLWHGIFLCTLGFIVGFFIPLYANPRAGLATHLLGITEGIFLAVVGLIFPNLKLSLFNARLAFWMLVISAYVGLLGELLGAAFGLTKVFIITAQGLSPGISWMESSVEIAVKGISVFIILACFILLFGLRKTNNTNH
ncbi:MAG: hypothetical protein KME64_11990 [Scytonematopsis contorta HA4267-MV1]|jgi:hydroxylaminobenzene mutase|nr:hypothetical protein [Scytonematopsis contorta HA4267-MV1]